MATVVMRRGALERWCCEESISRFTDLSHLQARCRGGGSDPCSRAIRDLTRTAWPRGFSGGHFGSARPPNGQWCLYPRIFLVILLERGKTETRPLQVLPRMELAGLEPAASWVRSRRSPN